MKKSVISIILSLCLIFSAIVPAFAAEEKYPFVFVHGMMGWGEGSYFESKNPYWGLSEEANVIPYLRAQGYEVYYPNVSGLGSCWDRCCELFAQLTGTVVDYGEAHSKEHGHARFGRDYTGKATMGTPWDLESKINLLGHSLGGPTVRMFASLLAYGNETEIAATGENTSALFTGGHDECINACVTLSGVHNGTIVSNYATDLVLPAVMLALFQNILSSTGLLFMDPMLDQWGLSAPPESGVRTPLDLFNCFRIILSGDHCGADMTMGGAQKLNEEIKTVPSTYYFSYTVRGTYPNIFGIETAIPTMFPLFVFTIPLIAFSEGMTVDGIYLDKSWTVSDGIVPLNSALYPSSEEDNHIFYEEGMELERGIWYVMPTMENTDHYDFCKTWGGFKNKENLFAFYKDMIDMVDALK